MGAFTHFALAASDEAMKHSGLVIDESNAEMVGTYISSGIGDFWAIEREHEKLSELRPGPRLAVLYRFGDRQSRVGQRFDPTRCQGPEFGNRDRVFGRCSRDRRQLSDHRTRRCRRDDLRRCRECDHADVGRGICVDAGAFDPE